MVFSLSRNINKCLLDQHPLTKGKQFIDDTATRQKVIFQAALFFIKKEMTEDEIVANTKQIVEGLVKSEAIEKHTSVWVHDCLWKALEDIVNPRSRYYWKNSSAT